MWDATQTQLLQNPTEKTDPNRPGHAKLSNSLIRATTDKSIKFSKNNSQSPTTYVESIMIGGTLQVLDLHLPCWISKSLFDFTSLSFSISIQPEARKIEVDNAKNVRLAAIHKCDK